MREQGDIAMGTSLLKYIFQFLSCANKVISTTKRKMKKGIQQ